MLNASGMHLASYWELCLLEKTVKLNSCPQRTIDDILADYGTSIGSPAALSYNGR